MLFCIGATEDAALGASSAARRHRQCFVKPSYPTPGGISAPVLVVVSFCWLSTTRRGP